MKDALNKLKVKYRPVSTLAVKFGYDVDWLRMRPRALTWNNIGLTVADAPALTNVLKSRR